MRRNLVARAIVAAALALALAVAIGTLAGHGYMGGALPPSW